MQSQGLLAEAALALGIARSHRGLQGGAQRLVVGVTEVVGDDAMQALADRLVERLALAVLREGLLDQRPHGGLGDRPVLS